MACILLSMAANLFERCMKVDKRRHPRFIKRLTAKVVINNESFTGISSDISENGIFIRTTRGLSADTPVDIRLLMPDNRISSLKGIVRRTTRTLISSMKNGMGVEITEKDGIFMNLLQSLAAIYGTGSPEKPVEPKVCMTSDSDHEVKDNNLNITDQERRQYRRLDVGQLQISGKIPNARKIQIINICQNGISAKADMRLNIGNKYLLKIAYKEKELMVKAAVIWSIIVDLRKDSSDNIVPVYSAGMQFKELPVEHMQELMQFINEQEDTGKTQNAMTYQNDEFINLNEHFSELFQESAR